MIGINQSFAQYSGMQVGAVIVLSQVIGGVLWYGRKHRGSWALQYLLWRELPAMAGLA